MKTTYELDEIYETWEYLKEKSVWAAGNEAAAKRYITDKPPIGVVPAIIEALYRFTDEGRGDGLRASGEDMLAALALLKYLREWAAVMEPKLIEAAKARSVTLERLAGPLGLEGRESVPYRLKAAKRTAAKLEKERKVKDEEHRRVSLSKASPNADSRVRREVPMGRPGYRP